jgi:hypothetical protein
MAIIIDIDHEANDLSEYTTTVTDSGDLSAAADAALAGTSYGLSVLIDDNTAIYGQYALSSPYSTTGITRVRVYFDPNTLTMTHNDQFYMVILYTGATSRVANLNVQMNSGFYRVLVTLVDDAAADNNASAVTVSDAPHYIEFMLTRASSNVASDGRLDWWIDGSVQTAITGKDNYDRFANFGTLRVGAVTGIDTGTRGTLYVDQIVVRDDNTEIGPVNTQSNAPRAFHQLQTQGIN